MNKEQFYVRLEKILISREWSRNRLAKESNIPKTTIYNMMARRNEPKLETMSKIIKGLQMSFDEFFYDDYKIDSPTEAQLELLKITDNLDARQLDKVIAYAQGLYESK